MGDKSHSTPPGGWQVFDRAAWRKRPRRPATVSIYVSGGSYQLRVNRAALALLEIQRPCYVRLLWDREKRLGAIEIDRGGKGDWRLCIQKGVGFIGCKLFIQEALGVTKKKRCRAWESGDRIVFAYGSDDRDPDVNDK